MRFVGYTAMVSYGWNLLTKTIINFIAGTRYKKRRFLRSVELDVMMTSKYYKISHARARVMRFVGSTAMVPYG